MIGAIISHYKILEKLGGGGMGVVYKAEDITLKRIVALKFLPSELTSDQQAKTRFLHEAQAASKIEHPNICAVHDIGQTDDGDTYIVMSFYEGETLKKKIARGRLKAEQALELAAQIADGLAKAHAAEIIHRDIKPANVLVTKEGIAKILDFGLAKLKGETKLTQTGATVGTLSYMAPEQVQGQESDARSDIWSLGVLLYEMLTGNPPFKGEHEGALLYEIMSADPPPLTNGTSDIDPEIQQLVTKCLEKDPEERYQAVKDVSVDCRHIKREMKTLRQMSGSYSHTGRGDSPSLSKMYPGSRSPRYRSRQTWMAISAALLCIVIYLTFRELSKETKETPFPILGELTRPENCQFYFVGAHAGPPALSPDSRRIAYVIRQRNDLKYLWIRKTDELVGRALNNTEGASYPFWSPDGQSIGFFSGSMLKRIDVESGVVKDICVANYGLGGSWNRDGLILFASSRSEPIYTVSEHGGNVVAVTERDSAKKEIYHQYPSFLPDGVHFFFLARTIFTGLGPNPDEICVGSIRSRERKTILKATSNAVFSNGFLLYQNMNNRNLMAVPFDLGALSISGESIPIAEVQINGVDGGGVFAASNSPTLIYQKPPTSSMTRLVIYDRTGREIGAVGGRTMTGGPSVFGQRAAYCDVRFSPDGNKVAYAVVDSLEGLPHIWTYDLLTFEKKRVAYSKGQDRLPVWTRDGKEMFFCSNRNTLSKNCGGGAAFELYRKSLLSGAQEVLIPAWAQYCSIQPFDCSPDGRYLAFVGSANQLHPGNQSDILTLSMDGKNTIRPFLEFEENEWDPRFSPDGKWMAFCSEQTKQSEIYVTPFPGPLNPEPISFQGGQERTGGRGPRWASNGTEIFYLTLDSKLVVAQVKPAGPTMQAVNVTPLFRVSAPSYAGNYDVSRDGSKIIVNSFDESSGPTVILNNWTELLKKR